MQVDEKEENKIGLPRHIMERLEKRRTKEGRKAERQARSNRARKAQEIQRELEELEVECQGVEERGVELEQLLREEEEGGEAMGEWYRLLGQKNRLVRREQELMVASKQLELEDQAERLEDKVGRGQEEEVLEQLLQNAEQRELLSAMLARDKERRDIQQQCASKVFEQFVQVPERGQRPTREDGGAGYQVKMKTELHILILSCSPPTKLRKMFRFLKKRKSYVH